MTILEKHKLYGKEVVGVRYHFTSQAQLALSYAKKVAKRCQNSYIGTEHLLLGIMKVEGAKLVSILQDYGVDYIMLYQDVESLFAFNKEVEHEMQYTSTVDEIIKECVSIAQTQEDNMADLDVLTQCMLCAQNNVAIELLKRYEINVEEVIDKLKLTNSLVLERFPELCNLNKKYMNHLSNIVCRDQELENMIDVLCRKMKANPLLIGEAGVGKSALVEELARRIANNQVPYELKDCVIYELNLNALVAGTKYRGEFEEKIQKLLQSVVKCPKAILFIDEIHMMVHAGKAEGSIDVAGVLKPYLARESFRCIGATTIDEYHKYMEKDRALKRRFQIIRIDEPSLSAIHTMVKTKIKEYSKHHDVEFPTNLVEECIQLSSEYLPQYTFPDKAMDMIDMSCVRAKKSGKKTVDQQCLFETVDVLSDIPRSYYNLLQFHKSDVVKLIGEEVYSQIEERILMLDQSLEKGKPIDIWCLRGKEESYKQEVARLIAHIFARSEKNLIVLDATLPNMSQLIELCELSKKHPFQVIYIKNYLMEESNGIIQNLLQQGIIHYKDIQVDLRFSLILIGQSQSQGRTLGFVNKTQLEDMNHFCLHVAEAGKVH